MTTNFGMNLIRESWEAHIRDPYSSIVVRSREGHISSNQENKLNEHGFVIRDKIINRSVFLPSVGALELLNDMREVETWKRNGIVIGVPTLTSSPPDATAVDEEILHTPSVRRFPEYALSASLKLTAEQSKVLFEFLLENEQVLKELANTDEIIARQQLTALFKQIAEFGRRKRLNKAE